MRRTLRRRTVFMALRLAAHRGASRRPTQASAIATLLVLGNAVLLATLFSDPARAHSDLLRTEPRYGAVLAAGPGQAVLYFDEPVDLGKAQVAFDKTSGGKAPDPGKPVHRSDDRRVVAVPLPPLSAGSYLLSWFFLAANDGHVVAGELALRISPSPTQPSAPVPAPVPAPPPATNPVAANATPTARFAPASNPVDAPAPPPDAAAPDVESLAGEPLAVTQRALGLAAAPAAVETASGSGIPGGPGVSPEIDKLDPARVAGVEAFTRLAGYASLTILVGGVAFVVLLWPEGAGLARLRRLLWTALLACLVATALTLALRGASLRGLSAFDALRPSVAGTLVGTHFGRVLVARFGFLLLAVPVLALLTARPAAALRSSWWRLSAAVVGLSALATHCLSGHAYAKGPLASAAAFVHLAAAAAWLGGLAVLALVVLPRREVDEVRRVVGRFSTMAFGAVSTMVASGAALLLLLSPRWGALAGSGYGRMLIGKLAAVAVLLATAQRARSFTQRRLVRTAGAASARLQPLVVAVGTELALALAVLSLTAVLVGRPPPN